MGREYLHEPTPVTGAASELTRHAGGSPHVDASLVGVGEAGVLLGLQQTAGNAAVLGLAGAVAQGQRPDGGVTEFHPSFGGGLPGQDLSPDRHRTEKDYWSLVSLAKGRGWVVAAACLEHYLTGHGTAKRDIPSAWLRDFGAVQEAEKTNERRFTNQLYDLVPRVPDGGSTGLSDYWDRQISVPTWRANELFFVSHNSILSSSGTFTLRRTGMQIQVSGQVTHEWKDHYAFHKGNFVVVPQLGIFPDDDAIALVEAGKAAPFWMFSQWKRGVSGTIDLRHPPVAARGWRSLLPSLSPDPVRFTDVPTQAPIELPALIDPTDHATT